MRKNDVIELAITGLTHEGSGVGHHEGMALFVPAAAPGDVIEARILKINKRYGFAKIERILTPSPDRAESGCAVYPACGGCNLRHITYEAECSIKDGWVYDNLLRIGGIDSPPEPFCPSPQTEEYRNKAQYPVRAQQGKLVCGFFASNSHRVVAHEVCPVQPRLFREIAGSILHWCEQNGISAYDEEQHKGTLRHIYLRRADATGEVMVCLVLNAGGFHGEKALAALLMQQYPQIVSVQLNLNRARTNVILSDKWRLIAGREYLVDEICGVRLHVSASSFLQVNPQCAKLLYETVRDFAALQGEELLLDLYCGTGVIGLTLAPSARGLVGADIVPAAVENARENAARSGIENARFLCADAGQAAQQLAAEGLLPDVVILDPPRKGCSAEVIDAVCKMTPQRIVMVSCNSATMARDCKHFAEKGYRVRRLRAVDMFPRTANVETCVLLSHKNPQTSPPSL